MDETKIDITNETDEALDASNFKDALLASLYTQVEFIKQVIKEKDKEIDESNLHIRTLLT